MTYTTNKKAPGTCDSKGLAADITSMNSPVTAHEGKVFASLVEFFALAAFQVFQNLKIDTRLTVDSIAAVRRALINTGVTV